MSVLNSIDLKNNTLAKVLTITGQGTLPLAIKEFLVLNGIKEESFTHTIEGVTSDLDKITNHPLITLSTAILKLSIESLSQAIVEELANTDNPCPSTLP